MNKIIVTSAVVLIGGILIVSAFSTKKDSIKESTQEVQKPNADTLSLTKEQMEMARKEVEETNSRILVTFSNEEKESNILSFKTVLEKRPETASVTFTSASQVLKNYRDKNKNDTQTIQTLDELGANPFGATLTITLKNFSQKESLSTYIESNTQYKIESVH
jgi:cell division protein FtsX